MRLLSKNTRKPACSSDGTMLKDRTALSKFIMKLVGVFPEFKWGESLMQLFSGD